jgi:hypothetical protein
MKRIIATLSVLLAAMPANADFGDADFPKGTFYNGPKSYHDAWCRKIKNNCRVRFAGPLMSVDGQGGILSSQLVTFKTNEDGEEYYTYIIYKRNNGDQQQALFLFANHKAHVDFLRALSIWRRQALDTRPNYRMPASQGPQDAQGDDKGLNPYSPTP